MRQIACQLTATVIVLSMVELPANAESPPAALERFLKRHAHFTKADFTALSRGEPVAKVMDTNRKTDVAAFGIIRLNSTREVFVQRLNDIANFKKSEYILNIGRLSQDPQPFEFEGVVLDGPEVKLFERCTVGDCGLQLSAESIELFRTELARCKEQEKQERGVALFREMLLRCVRSYMAEGNLALIRYADRDPARNLADELQDMLSDSGYLREYVPELTDYLLRFPLGRPPDTKWFVYWSKEKYGLKAVISLTHVVIYPRDVPGASAVIVASKQIYASHYLDASLGLGAFLQLDSTAQDSYLMYLNRSRSGLLGGWLGFLKRPLVRRRVRDGLVQNLRVARSRLQ